MGWPDLTYRSRIEPELRNELEQLVALTQGYLAAEHGADGQHTVITVDGIQFRGPDGTILATIGLVDGVLTVTFPPTTPPGQGAGLQVSDVLVGHHHGVPGGTFTHNAGIDLNTDAPPDQGGKWLVGAGRDTLADALVFATYAAANSVGEGVALYFSAGTFAGYALCPPAAGSLLLYRLGSRLDSRLLWDEINGKTVYARDGYQERGRTVPLGEWIPVPFNAANFVGTGAAWTVTAGQVSTNQYTLLGKTMVWTITLSNSTVSAPGASSLTILLPPGITTPAPNGSFAMKPGLAYDAAGPQQDYTLQTSGGGGVVLTRNGPAIPAGVFFIYFTMTMEVN